MASINLQSKDGGGDGSVSPTRLRGVSSPWSKIVSGERGELSPPVVSVTAPATSPSSSSIQEQIVSASSDWNSPKAVRETVSSPNDPGTECQPEGSDNGGGGSNAVKKPVWSKPSNGVVEVVSPVMGAVSWPALGESTKAAPKSSSSESLQALSDVSLLPALQASANPSPSSQKLASANNPTSTPNHVATSGQRSAKRSGGGSGALLLSNGGVSQRSSATQDSKVELSHNTSGKPVTAGTDSHPKDHSYKESPRASFGSQPNSGNDHHRNSYRRGNGSQHPRGDGSYHHNYGGKLDHGRGNGNQEWNQHRNFNNRDTNMQPQRGFRRGYIQRPSVHNSTPFIHPPMPVPVRPFGNHVMYPDVAAAMIYVPGATPLVGPMPAPMYFSVPDPLLHGKIVNQIDYYFSNENLVKDTYLRQNMDEQGWVPVSLIAGFKKVSILIVLLKFHLVLVSPYCILY